MATLHIGDYFLFLLGADYTDSIRLHFRDHENKIKGSKFQQVKIRPGASSYQKNRLPKISSRESRSVWREKVYLSPVILQRKWIDYRYRDRFIPATGYDTVLPIEMNYPFINSTHEDVSITLDTFDKNYRNVVFQLLNEEGQPVFQHNIDNITVKESKTISVAIKSPGLYRVILYLEDKPFRKSSILFYRNKSILNFSEKNEDIRMVSDLLDSKAHRWRLYCRLCWTICSPVETQVIDGYVRKNYIPIKEYLDIEGLGMDFISNYLMDIKHPASYRSGLIHLLNMLRLASVDDEIKIVTNLFSDDPPFAYYITDKLFLFDMIPLMENRELQRVLNRIDDPLLASALSGEKGELVSKVLKNVSRRRAKSIENLFTPKPGQEEHSMARGEVNRTIKSYFEERFGRELKIPSEKRIIYREKQLNGSIFERLLKDIPHHSGGFILFDGNDIYELIIPDSGDVKAGGTCIRYDFEASGYEIFSLAGVSETTLFLHSNVGIHLAVVHLYDWITSLEDVFFVENLPRNSVLPMKRDSSSLILTVGAIDAKGHPHEQLIRLRVKEI
ncbi:MAG: FliG C-terminal domain-containing protein [Spirochaetota bacterium]